jgi:excisionase family DNA binding protein
MLMENKDFFSTAELAKVLGISRVAVFNRIKKGQIKAIKIGRSFVIAKKDLENILSIGISENDKEKINQAVKKTVKEYGETLKMLGNK